MQSILHDIRGPRDCDVDHLRICGEERSAVVENQIPGGPSCSDWKSRLNPDVREPLIRRRVRVKIHSLAEDHHKDKNENGLMLDERDIAAI